MLEEHHMKLFLFTITLSLIACSQNENISANSENKPQNPQQHFEQDENSALRNAKVTSFAMFYRKQVLETAQTEKWTATEFQALKTISQLASYKNGCFQYVDQSSLVNCSGGELYNRQSNHFFDPDFQNRYPKLAREFLVYIRVQDNKPENRNLDLILANSFFEPVWSKCDNDDFKSNALELKNLLRQLKDTLDPQKKSEIENVILESLKNC